MRGSQGRWLQPVPSAHARGHIELGSGHEIGLESSDGPAVVSLLPAGGPSFARAAAGKHAATIALQPADALL